MKLAPMTAIPSQNLAMKSRRKGVTSEEFYHPVKEDGTAAHFRSASGVKTKSWAPGSKDPEGDGSEGEALAAKGLMTCLAAELRWSKISGEMRSASGLQENGT